MNPVPIMPALSWLIRMRRIWVSAVGWQVHLAGTQLVIPGEINPLEQAFRFDIEHLDIPSLEIYLLFSCLDTLAGQPVHTDFGVWLPKQVTGEALTVEEVQQLYERYQDEQGVSRNLRALFYALPYALKTWVSSHVRIGRIQSKHVDWEQNEEKLLRHLFD